MDWREDVWSRFRKLWPGVTAIAVVLQMLDGRGTTNPIDIVIYMAVIGVSLTPLLDPLRDPAHPRPGARPAPDVRGDRVRLSVGSGGARRRDLRAGAHGD
jgi:hypothetical protein